MKCLLFRQKKLGKSGMKNKITLKTWFSLMITIVLFAGCGQDYAPKPRSFFRIDFPEKKYKTFTEGCNYTFDYPVYAKMVKDTLENAQNCWFDVAFPSFNGRLHLSYYPITSQKEFNQLVEDSRKLAFKHTVKATGIEEGTIRFADRKVYGTYYDIDGNTASSVQFILTDSTKNYLRGALYFNEQPRQDSIQPVIDFVKKDIDVMIKTLKWKN